MHGQWAPAVFSVTATTPQGDGLVRISALGKVDRSHFGVRAMGAVVSSLMSAEIEAVGTPLP